MERAERSVRGEGTGGEGARGGVRGAQVERGESMPSGWRFAWETGGSLSSFDSCTLLSCCDSSRLCSLLPSEWRFRPGLGIGNS